MMVDQQLCLRPKGKLDFKASDMEFFEYIIVKNRRFDSGKDAFALKCTASQATSPG